MEKYKENVYSKDEKEYLYEALQQEGRGSSDVDLQSEGAEELISYLEMRDFNGVSLNRPSVAFYTFLHSLETIIGWLLSKESLQHNKNNFKCIACKGIEEHYKLQLREQLRKCLSNVPSTITQEHLEQKLFAHLTTLWIETRLHYYTRQLTDISYKYGLRGGQAKSIRDVVKPP